MELELFSINIKLLLRDPILGSKFYIFEKFSLSAFAGKKINAIAIVENFLSPREFTYCKKLIFGAMELHFQVQKSKCPSTFLKISVRALHFRIYLIGRNKCPYQFGKDPYQIGADTYFPQSGKNEFLSNQCNFLSQIILKVILISIFASIKEWSPSQASDLKILKSEGEFAIC